MPDWKDRILSATCAVRAGKGERPLGTGVLIEPDKVLTCRHVITEDGEPDGAERPGLLVTFPDGESAEVVSEQGYVGCDAVVLTLRAQRSPHLTAVLSGSYRAPARVELLGYPTADRTDDAVWRSFAVHGPTASGLVQLDWQDGGSFRGHSGGPVVDAATGRLVGLLREGSEAGRFDRYLPLRRMLESGVLGRLPWLVEGDDAESHFTRRASGRSAVAGRDLFTGRERALERATTWLTRADATDATGRVLVVTGRPGAGKSALIARAGTSVMGLRRSDPRWRGLLFHARNADDAQFRRAVADLFGAPSDLGEAELLEAADAIAEAARDRRWVVVVDGLDEAASAEDRRSVASLLANLARRPWTRTAVATRPLSPSGPFGAASLLRRFGVTGPDDEHLLDLDTGAYFELEDLTVFTERLLQQDDQRFPGPDGAAWRTYRDDDDLRRRLAEVIAVRADRNFLVASLTAHPLSEGAHVLDPRVAGFREDTLPGNVGEALERYLDHRPEGALTRGVLTALAYAEGSGVDDATWRLFGAALGYPVEQVVLDELRRSPIADYLLQSTSEVGGHLTRLFHRALVDQLLRARDRRGDQSLIFEALRARAMDGGGWGRAGAYVHARLAVHAAGAGRLGELLTDPEFLLVAHLGRLRRLAEEFDLDREGAEYRAVLDLAGAGADALQPRRRAFLFSVAAAHLGLATVARGFDRSEASAAVRWAHGLGRLPGVRDPGEAGSAAMEPGHELAVLALAAVPMPDGATLIAASYGARTTRLWDPATGHPHGDLLAGQAGGPTALLPVLTPGGPTLLATAEGERGDLGIRLWRLADGRRHGDHLTDREHLVWALAAVPGPDGRTLIAAAGGSGTIRFWDPATGRPHEDLLTRQHDVSAMVAVELADGRTLLAAAGLGGQISLWDPATAEEHGSPLTGHDGAVWSLAAVRAPGGRPVLLSAGSDLTVRFWDPATGRQRGEPLDLVEIGRAMTVHGNQLAVGTGRAVAVFDLRLDRLP